MAASVATLRAKIEGELRERVFSPFSYRDRNLFELVSTGIAEIDASVGGLPRGAMTEICGPPCSGRTSLLSAALATRTAEGEACALVDARDSFDPQTARAAGVALRQLLWVRCQNIDQALRATDLLIQGGGFGLVAVDLGDIAPKTARGVPLNAWFRFRRAVEDTPTILLLIEQESNAKTCASLVLRMGAAGTDWSEAGKARKRGEEADDGGGEDLRIFPFARLLKRLRVRGETVRSRIQMSESRGETKEMRHAQNAGEPIRMAAHSDAAEFVTTTMWNSFGKFLASRREKESSGFREALESSNRVNSERQIESSEIGSLRDRKSR